MKKNFDDRKKHIENELIEKCKCDEKTITLIDNIMTYAIGNVFMVGYEDTKEFLLCMLDGVLNEADILAIMHDLFDGIQS